MLWKDVAANNVINVWNTWPSFLEAAAAAAVSSQPAPQLGIETCWNVDSCPLQVATELRTTRPGYGTPDMTHAPRTSHDRRKRQRNGAVASWSVLFFSRPRSEGWPHHGRTFSICPCPLSFWLTLPRRILSTSWCCPSRPCVAFLACVHLRMAGYINTTRSSRRAR